MEKAPEKFSNYKWVMDCRSVKAPSGIMDTSFPCNDLRFNKKKERKENGNQHVRDNESRCVGTYKFYLDFTQTER
jgi:hypothetical protein